MDNPSLSNLIGNISSGNFESANEILENEPYVVKMQDFKGDTALHLMVSSDNANAVKWLLNNGANPKTPNKEGDTPLHLAASYGNVKVAQLLLAKGSDTEAVNKLANKPFNNSTPFESYTQTLFRLNTNSQGNTSLHLAVLNGHHEMVELLLDHRASITAMNGMGSTPLKLAVITDKVAMAQLLLDKGAVDTINMGDIPPLHQAIDQDNFDMVKLLLERGANIEATDRDQNTPLQKTITGEKVEIAKFLFSYGANPRITRPDGDSILHLSARANMPAPNLTSLFIERGGLVNTLNMFNRTPLSYVEHSSDNQVAEILRKHGGINVTGNYLQREHPLHEAIIDNDIAVIQLILNQGNPPDINQGDANGVTPLHLATMLGNMEMVQILLSQEGINVNSQDVNGQSPLHVAAGNHNLEVAQLLVADGGLLTVKNNFGKTPLQISPLFQEEKERQILKTFFNPERIKPNAIPADYQKAIVEGLETVKEIHYGIPRIAQAPTPTSEHLDSLGATTSSEDESSIQSSEEENQSAETTVTLPEVSLHEQEHQLNGPVQSSNNSMASLGTGHFDDSSFEDGQLVDSAHTAAPTETLSNLSLESEEQKDNLVEGNVEPIESSFHQWAQQAGSNDPSPQQTEPLIEGDLYTISESEHEDSSVEVNVEPLESLSHQWVQPVGSDGPSSQQTEPLKKQDRATLEGLASGPQNQDRAVTNPSHRTPPVSRRPTRQRKCCTIL